MRDTQPGQARESDGLQQFTPFFKAFCNGTRARIIELLMSGEKCVCEIVPAVGGSQPLVSHHLAILLEAGFVRRRGDGARAYYSIDWESFDERLAGFQTLVEVLRESDIGPSCACG